MLKIILFFIGFSSITLSAQTTVKVSSLAELSKAVQDSNQNIVMEPGDYNLSDLSSDSRKIICSGSNNTINLTGVYVTVTVGSVNDTYITISGNNNAWRGGEFEDVYKNGMTKVTDFSAYNQDRVNLAKGIRGNPVMRISGEDNLVTNLKLTVKGSFPYGYGSAFGIGSNNVYGLDKRCGIYMSAANITLDSIEVQQRAFGHAIFMGKGADNILIKNSLVEGILRPSADLYEETDSKDLPVKSNYILPCDVAGNCDNGGPIPRDQMYTLTEDGIRIYPGARSIRVENTTVKKTRGGIRLYFGIEDTKVVNCTVLDCGSTNFNLPSGGTITGSKGNFAYAPLSDFRTNKSNQNIDITILPSPHAMGSHNIMDIGGDGHEIFLRRAPGPLDEDEERAIVVKGSNSTIHNETEYAIILDSKASGNTVVSFGKVTDNGENNTVTQTK